MLDNVVQMTRASSHMTGVESIDPAILSVMREVDRRLFVPEEVQDYAYINEALPIGQRQTISQPFIVAIMTHFLDPDSDQTVLEIGTGSGYQAAILAKLVKHVYSIEIIPELAKEAEERLADLEFDNVTVKVGDGWFGWPEHAQFDGIIVTAQAPEIPQMLVDQLAVGGRMVIPVGPEDHVQTLEVVTKTSETDYSRAQVLPVAFVPMTGEAQKIDP